MKQHARNPRRGRTGFDVFFWELPAVTLKLQSIRTWFENKEMSVILETETITIIKSRGAELRVNDSTVDDSSLNYKSECHRGSK